MDRARVRKSLRRKGFDHGRLLAELESHVARANAILASWVAAVAR